MKICVIIPVYNECEAVGFVVKSVLQKGLDVLVINDGSTDESGTVALEHGARVITNPAKTGKGASLRRGFQKVLEEDYDGVITMDGDGQHDAQDLDKILHKAQACPHSIVNGTRMTDPHGMPLVRFLTNKVMSWMISLVCRQKISDTQCGFRYIDTGILQTITLASESYEIETETLIKASRAGFPVYCVPVRTIYSSEKSKVHPVKDTIRFLKYFLKELWG